MTSKLSEYFWPPLFQTNRISRRINKLSENLTSLSIFTLKIKQFLWKYHTLPSLFWAALILLRSKQRKYQPWKVYSPEQNGVLCDCFASFQITFLKAEMVSFHSKYFVYRELKRAPQKFSFCFKCPDTRQHTVQRLISTGIRDIHNWIRDVFRADNSKCSRARVARRVGTKCLFKSNK